MAASKRKHPEPPGLSVEELEDQSAEALPERAAMSTVSVTPLDATTGAVEAFSTGLTDVGDTSHSPWHARAA